MKVLHIATRHKYGGAERNLLHTIERERARGWDVSIAVGGDSDVSSIPAEVATHQLQQLERDLAPRHELGAVRELRRLIGRGAYDVVHTHQSKAGIVGRIAAVGVARQIVHTIHMPSFGPSYATAASVAFRAAERGVARRTDFFVAVGEELRRIYLAAGIGRDDRFSVIPSPLDIQAFADVRDNSASTADGPPLVVAAGTLEPRKRYELILRELAPLLRGDAARLVVAGRGPSERHLRALAEELGVTRNVEFLGFVQDLPSLMADARLLVHASAVEGVPQVVIQALAAGLPVVATEAEGLREVSAAPIAIGRRDGADLARAVCECLAARSVEAVSLEALTPWTVEEVNRRLARFHASLETAVADHRTRASTK